MNDIDLISCQYNYNVSIYSI